ncbi:putative splicing factor 3b subunit 2 [Trichonephila clavipes]|nr:putative splicing factor 3b subunit 2 [Trichonephila clavipes]
MLRVDPDAVAQPVAVERKKRRVDLDDDEIGEEKPKLPPKRKLKELSRMIVAKLQQKGNLKASSNIVLVPQHWSFKRKYSQDKGGIEKLAWKLPDFIKRIGVMKVRQLLQERENRKTTKVKMRKRVRLKLTKPCAFWDRRRKSSGTPPTWMAVEKFRGKNHKGQPLESLTVRGWRILSRTEYFQGLVPFSLPDSVHHCGRSRQWFTVRRILCKGTLARNPRCSRLRRIGEADISTSVEVDQCAVNHLEEAVRSFTAIGAGVDRRALTSPSVVYC